MPIIDITVYNNAIELHIFSNGSTKQCRIIPFDKKYKNDIKEFLLDWTAKNNIILKSPGYECTIDYINNPHPYVYQLYQLDQLDQTIF